MDRSSDSMLPSMILPVFMDEGSDFILPSMISPVFVDGNSDFMLPSTVSLVFMDGSVRSLCGGDLPVDSAGLFLEPEQEVVHS